MGRGECAALVGSDGWRVICSGMVGRLSDGMCVRTCVVENKEGHEPHPQNVGGGRRCVVT